VQAQHQQLNSISTQETSLKSCYTPLAIVKHNKHAFRVVIEHLVMMTICVADDKVKYACVNNVQQKRTGRIERSPSNVTAVMLSIILPPINKSMLLICHNPVSYTQTEQLLGTTCQHGWVICSVTSGWVPVLLGL